jgi:hypothetical protein
VNNTKNKFNYFRKSQSCQLLLPAPEPPHFKTNVTSSSQTAFGRKSKWTSSRIDIKTVTPSFVNTIWSKKRRTPGGAGSRTKEWEEKWTRNRWQYLRLRSTVCTGGIEMLQHSHSESRLQEKLDLKVTEPFRISSINFFFAPLRHVSAKYQKCQWYNGKSTLELCNQASILSHLNLRKHRRLYAQTFIFSRGKKSSLLHRLTWVVKNIHNYAGWHIWCIVLCFRWNMYEIPLHSIPDIWGAFWNLKISEKVWYI